MQHLLSIRRCHSFPSYPAFSSAYLDDREEENGADENITVIYTNGFESVSEAANPIFTGLSHPSEPSCESREFSPLEERSPNKRPLSPEKTSNKFIAVELLCSESLPTIDISKALFEYINLLKRDFDKLRFDHWKHIKICYIPIIQLHVDTRIALQTLPKNEACQKLIRCMVRQEEIFLDRPSSQVLTTHQLATKILENLQFKYRKICRGDIKRHYNSLHKQREVLSDFIFKEEIAWKFPRTVIHPLTDKWISLRNFDELALLISESKLLEVSLREFLAEMRDIDYANEQLRNYHLVLNDNYVEASPSPIDCVSVRDTRIAVDFMAKLVLLLRNKSPQNLVFTDKDHY